MINHSPQIDSPTQFFLKYQNSIFLVLTIIFGLVFLWPFIDYQPFLAQGDHGRDLYAFVKTLDGQSAYRDYWWVYGPLMPYYYAGFDAWLGKNIQSVLVGERLLQLGSGLLIYFIMAAFFPCALGCLAAVWFWVTTSDIFTMFAHEQSPLLINFFFTYNHTGGVTALLGAFYCLVLYFKNPRRLYLALGLLCLFLLLLIKLNFGLMAWAAFVFFVFMADFLMKNPPPRQKDFYIAAFLLPVLALLIYLSCLRGLTVNEIRQCLPYLKGDQPYETSLTNSLLIFINYLKEGLKASKANIVIMLFFVGAFLGSVFALIRTKKEPISKIFFLSAVVLFLVVNLHEFLLSGVMYRAFWARPFQILLFFGLLGTAREIIPDKLKPLSYFLFSLLAAIMIWESSFQIQQLQKLKTPDHFISLPKAKVYIGNGFPWIDTVKQTTEYLEGHLAPDEKFFALPYDCLYYYLTGRTSPTRQLIFFDHIKIPTEQELRIIKEIDDQKINWVVLSSRYIAKEQGLGQFGVTYCPLLAKYLEEHFLIDQRFGDWHNEPGWAWNHGTMILKRK